MKVRQVTNWDEVEKRASPAPNKFFDGSMIDIEEELEATRVDQYEYIDWSALSELDRRTNQ